MNKNYIDNYYFDNKSKKLTISFILNDDKYIGKEVYIDIYSIIIGKVKYINNCKEILFTEKILLKHNNKLVLNLSNLKYISNYDGVNIGISHSITISYEGGFFAKNILNSNIILNKNNSNTSKIIKELDVVNYRKILGLIPIIYKNIFYLLGLLSLSLIGNFNEYGPFLNLDKKEIEIGIYLMVPFFYLLFVYESHTHTYVIFPKFNKKIILDDKVNIFDLFNGVSRITLENYKVEISLLNREKFLLVKPRTGLSDGGIEYKNEYVNKVIIFKKDYNDKFKGNKIFTNEKMYIDRDFVKSKICETNILNEFDLLESQGVKQYIEFRLKSNDYNDLVRRYNIV